MQIKEIVSIKCFRDQNLDQNEFFVKTMIENVHINQSRPIVMNAVMNANVFVSFYETLQRGDREKLRDDMYTTKAGMAQTNSLRFHINDLVKTKIAVPSRTFH